MRRTRFLISRTGRFTLAAVGLALALSGLTAGGAAAAGHAAGPLPLVVRTDHGLVRATSGSGPAA